VAKNVLIHLKMESGKKGVEGGLATVVAFS